MAGYAEEKRGPADGRGSPVVALRAEWPAPGRLPVRLSSFVGREREVAEVVRLLDEHRLVTIVGPGGFGKTRLALAVASTMTDASQATVWWVGLASLAEPELVPDALA